ncbi:hypothetical protein BDV98DRAFT_561260 [Pterulicium gracile]|uniref:Uncharacterized protein n=1 Tax=Pterulicium gracile TaxID=1884261 RepID=A0A5C3QWP9_9AGAR|nr:hypothetical protein BDV98DRAFT_561260 [Pterula gracilis]
MASSSWMRVAGATFFSFLHYTTAWKTKVRRRRLRSDRLAGSFPWLGTGFGWITRV